MKKFIYDENGIYTASDTGIKEFFINRPYGLDLLHWCKVAFYVCENLNVFIPMVERASYGSRFYLVSIDHKYVYKSDAQHLTGQTIAKHIKDVLRNYTHASDGDGWEESLLRNVDVKSITVK